ncbi:uclacyanin 1 [Pistacia vera]|uniref:uclacyanin 1 n=1 Tax=Pistacia vera TaxID=55513 RepID=UPI001263520C|nr:uclacyanin 1 [Pistacia vera]
MAVLRILISLAVVAMFIQLSMAANYTVGGTNGGWDTSTDLQSWASSQSFQVGDNLIFQYIASHDVLEVSKADYDSCQSTRAVQSFSDGNTVIPLSSPGKRYFICGTVGHCSQGMKVEITTLATSSPPSISPATSPTATPLSPANPPDSSVTPSTSPAPEISAPSPEESPKSAPTLSPTSSSDSPQSSPLPSFDVPSTSLPPSGSSPQLPPSSATKCGFETTLTMGFSFGLLILLCL